MIAKNKQFINNLIFKIMRLDNVKGYFDVREYNAKKVRTERTMKADDATITFDVVFDGQSLPEQVAKHAKS